MWYRVPTTGVVGYRLAPATRARKPQSRQSGLATASRDWRSAGKGKGPGLPDTSHRDAQTAKAQIKLWRSLSHGLKGLLPRVFLGALKARQCGGPHLINGDSNADPAALPMCRDRFRPRRFKSQKQKQMRAGEALKQKSGVANPGTFSTWIPLDSFRIVPILASLFRLMSSQPRSLALGLRGTLT